MWWFTIKLGNFFHNLVVFRCVNTSYKTFFLINKKWTITNRLLNNALGQGYMELIVENIVKYVLWIVGDILVRFDIKLLQIFTKIIFQIFGSEVCIANLINAIQFEWKLRGQSHGWDKIETVSTLDKRFSQDVFFVCVLSITSYRLPRHAYSF